jgi:MOSC domain-containing protein YiiM
MHRSEAPEPSALVGAHRTREALDAALAGIRSAPADGGRVVLVVRRPAVDAREVLAEGMLDPAVGLVGDTWCERPSTRTADGGPHPDMQLNVISSRVAEALAGSEGHRALAGDQLHLDLDLSEASLPAGTRLAVGDAVIEVTDQPHRGCAKFSARFGADALRWVNAAEHAGLRLRGLNAKVVSAGPVRPGDAVRRLP